MQVRTEDIPNSCSPFYQGWWQHCPGHHTPWLTQYFHAGLPAGRNLQNVAHATVDANPNPRVVNKLIGRKLQRADVQAMADTSLGATNFV